MRKAHVFVTAVVALAMTPGVQAEFVLHRPPPPPAQTVEAVFEAVAAEEAEQAAVAEVAVQAAAPEVELSADLSPVESEVADAISTEARYAEPVEVYRIEAGESLRDAYARWCAEAGWSLVWRARYSFVAEASHAFDGPLPVAAERALRGFEPSEGKRLLARAYTGNRVLVVDAVGGGAL